MEPTHKRWMLSLAGNLLLGGALIWALTVRQPVAVTATALQAVEGDNVAPRVSWQQIASADYVAYVNNLRALGCPEASIADLIVGEVTAQYSERWRAAVGTPVYQYWATATTTALVEQTRLRELRARLERERRELLLRVLGAPALRAMAKYQLWNDVDPDAEILGFLPQAKREQLFAIQHKYATSVSEDMLVTEAALRRAAADQARQRAQIAALLSAQELEELDLRKSDTAQRLRQELKGFQASEAEFRQLFRIRRGYEATLAANTDVRDPNVLQVRIEAERRLAEEARAALGEQRYSDYQRARDPDYQNALQLAEFFSLPGETAARLYELKRVVETRASAITANAALSEARRAELLGEMQTDTERTLQSWLGAEVLAEYRRNNRWWMWSD